ncbi:MAG: hypothetical protein PF517_20575 [Salinivirgaceae bacterium]|nr:hypothetical protein [Salinivirgaceae bacterium]
MVLLPIKWVDSKNQQIKQKYFNYGIMHVVTDSLVRWKFEIWRGILINVYSYAVERACNPN